MPKELQALIDDADLFDIEELEGWRESAEIDRFLGIDEVEIDEIEF